MQDFQIFETLFRLVLLAANQLRFGEQIYSQFFFFLFVFVGGTCSWCTGKKKKID